MKRQKSLPNFCRCCGLKLHGFIPSRRDTCSSWTAPVQPSQEHSTVRDLDAKHTSRFTCHPSIMQAATCLKTGRELDPSSIKQPTSCMTKRGCCSHITGQQQRGCGEYNAQPLGWIAHSLQSMHEVCNLQRSSHTHHGSTLVPLSTRGHLILGCYDA